MRCPRLSLLLSLLAAGGALAEIPAESSGDSTGLQPLIAEGDKLLAAGHFSEAARAYSDAIGSQIYCLTAYDHS